MKRKWFLGLLFIVSINTNAEGAISTTFEHKPKLVVGIVVDQMRADFIYRYWSKYGQGGFKRLVSEGFFFKNTHYNYVPTYTGPGHATIYSGATPSVHGIIANNWFDKNLGEKIYCTDDLTVHALGGTEKAGQMSPKNLLTTTVGDQLKLASLQHSKVLGIALKDRGAILSAGHSANAAYWFDAKTGGWMSSDYYMKQLPNWVNSFNNNGLAKKYLSSVWQPLLPLSDYQESLTDDSVFEGKLKGEVKPVFPHDLAKLAVDNDNFGLLKTTPFGNSLTKEFAIAAIQAENLGKNAATDMLAISFSATDYVGHLFAPQSVEVEDTYLRLDRDLAQLLTFLDHWLGKEQVLVFLTADHGVAENPGYLQSLKIPTGNISETALGQAVQAFLREKFSADLLLSYSNQQVFLNQAKIAELSLSTVEVENAVANFLLKNKGVAGVVTRTALMQGSFAEKINQAIQSGYHLQRAGDVVVNYAPGWIDSEKITGTTHGSPYGYDTHVPLLWYGWKIAHGQSFQAVDITDIATTLSLLLDMEVPNGNFGKFMPLLLK